MQPSDPKLKETIENKAKNFMRVTSSSLLKDKKNKSPVIHREIVNRKSFVNQNSKTDQDTE